MKHTARALRSILLRRSNSNEAALNKALDNNSDAAYLLGAIRALNRGDNAQAAQHLRTFADILTEGDENE